MARRVLRAVGAGAGVLLGIGVGIAAIIGVGFLFWLGAKGLVTVTWRAIVDGVKESLGSLGAAT